MYAYKSLLIHAVTLYENNLDEFNGINKLFNAFADVMIYNWLVHGKKLDIDLIDRWNMMLHFYRTAKDPEQKTKFHIGIKRIIDVNYTHIVNVLSELKDVQPISLVEANIDRVKVKGCIGTVIEA